MRRSVSHREVRVVAAAFLAALAVGFAWAGSASGQSGPKPRVVFYELSITGKQHLGWTEINPGCPVLTGYEVTDYVLPATTVRVELPVKGWPDIDAVSGDAGRLAGMKVDRFAQPAECTWGTPFGTADCGKRSLTTGLYVRYSSNVEISVRQTWLPRLVMPYGSCMPPPFHNHDALVNVRGPLDRRLLTSTPLGRSFKVVIRNKEHLVFSDHNKTERALVSWTLVFKRVKAPR